MITLRMVVDPAIARVPSGASRYAAELTRALIQTAPDGCAVEGIAAAHPKEALDALRSTLPGLTQLVTAPLPRRELSRAWQLGLGIPLGGGMVHSPTLLAPLRRHDRVNDGEQITVTLHDVAAWTRPESLTPGTVSWQKAMLKRARKHADAVVVPTHAVAEQLSEIVDLGDRIRVIPGAVSSALRLGDDADERARRLGLPERFIVAYGSPEPRKGVASLIEGLALPSAPDLPLVVVGPPEWGDLTVQGVAEEAGLGEDRVIALGVVDDADLAVVLDRASLFVYPSTSEGSGTALVEAFAFGVPVIHADDPALVEVGDGAGLVVEREGRREYPERLAVAMAAVLDDASLRDRLGVAGSDRARAFSWRDSAERVWELHASL